MLDQAGVFDVPPDEEIVHDAGDGDKQPYDSDDEIGAADARSCVGLAQPHTTEGDPEDTGTDLEPCEFLAEAHEKVYRMLEGDVCGLGYFEDGLGVGALLPGGADGFDAGVVVGGCGVVDDEELGAFALGCGLLLPLPLAVDVEDGEAGREAWGDFLVEELAPCCLGSGFGDGADAEVEMGFYPVGGLRVGDLWSLGIGWGLVRGVGLAGGGV